MTDKEIEEARHRGEEWGKMTSQTDSNTRRIGRLENGLLAVLTSAAALWAKSKGLW